VADDDGKVAACACRENTSKTAKIPAAKIATCTARRAMCRKVARDTRSPPVQSGETDLAVVPTITGPKPARSVATTVKPTVPKPLTMTPRLLQSAG
jgi:hypothetical protein